MDAPGNVDARALLTVVAGCVTREGRQQEKAYVTVSGKTMREGRRGMNQPSERASAYQEVENETMVVKDLLDPVDVKDRVWTADALRTSQRIEQPGVRILLYSQTILPLPTQSACALSGQGEDGSFADLTYSQRMCQSPEHFALFPDRHVRASAHVLLYEISSCAWGSSAGELPAGVVLRWDCPAG